jgi:hypothetical protein
MISPDTRLKETGEDKGNRGATEMDGCEGLGGGQTKDEGGQYRRAEQRDLRREAPSITSPQPFTSTSTPFFWLRSCKFPLRGYITSSLGLKITSGLPSIFSCISASEPEDIERGRRVDNSSKSLASVLGYFDRSSVGANFHYPLHVSYGE